MFTLKTTLAKNSNTDIEDSATVKMALTALGYYDDTETGLSPYSDDQLFDSVKNFQKDNSLEVDGVIKPDGPTQKSIKDRLTSLPDKAGAYYDFSRNYVDMVIADTKDADKYFHCKANYEATVRGWAGQESAEYLSDQREIYGQKVEKDPIEDMIADQKANLYGRQGALSGKFKSGREACAIFRPNGLNEKY